MSVKSREPEWKDLPTTTLQVRHNTSPPGMMAEPAQDRAVLVVLSGGTQGSRHLLDKGEVVLGRATDADIQVDTDDASRYHARIFRRPDGEQVIEDRGSRNGTSVNNIPIKRHVLKPGDRIRLGNQAVFLFTRQSPLEDKFLDAQKLESIGRLAGGIAHDFNNLMASLLADIGYLKSVCDAKDPPPDAKECLDNMERAARRSVELTSQLLSFAQQVAVDIQRLDLSDLVQDVARFLGRTFGPNIEIRTEELRPGLHILGDRTQLRQLLVNLCLNARDAMPGGGTLTVRGEIAELSAAQAQDLPPLHPGPHVLLSVTDTGCGMDANTRSRIFEPFFTTREVGQGTGLGLAAVYGIVKKHNGQIHVESEPGQGATFHLWIPAHVSQERPRVSAPTAGALPQMIRETADDLRLMGDVLVAEDDLTLRKEISQWIQQMGHRVLVAKDGHEALMQLLEHRQTIQLVVLDMVMPRLSGKETFRRLRQLDPGVKVLMVSGYVDPGRVDELKQQGINEFLGKPFSEATLRDAVRRTMDST